MRSRKNSWRLSKRCAKKAHEAGNLKSNDQVTYKEEQAKTDKGETKTVIVVQPAKPEIVYVPTYNPALVYGHVGLSGLPAPIPIIRQVITRPEVCSGSVWDMLSATIGGGGCHWGHNNVKINVNVYNNNRYTVNKINNSNWKHNSYHRKAVPYRNDKVSKRHGESRKRNTKARESYRGPRPTRADVICLRSSASKSPISHCRNKSGSQRPGRLRPGKPRQSINVHKPKRRPLISDRKPRKRIRPNGPEKRQSVPPTREREKAGALNGTAAVAVKVGPATSPAKS